LCGSLFTNMNFNDFSALIALLNFVILLIQLSIKAEIKRLDEKTNFLSDRIKTLEKCVWDKKND